MVLRTRTPATRAWWCLVTDSVRVHVCITRNRRVWYGQMMTIAVIFQKGKNMVLRRPTGGSCKRPHQWNIRGISICFMLKRTSLLVCLDKHICTFLWQTLVWERACVYIVLQVGDRVLINLKWAISMFRMNRPGSAHMTAHVSGFYEYKWTYRQSYLHGLDGYILPSRV